MDFTNRGTVIVVNDDKAQLGYITAVLEKEGFRVLASPNVDEALAENNRLEERIRQLRQSEHRYRQLFDKMLNGFALYEIVCDGGTPCDFRFLDVNPAFEKLIGVGKDDLAGRTAREMFPELEDEWLEIFGKVALTGEPAHFEKFDGRLEKYFEVLAFCPEKGRCAVTVNEITERIKAEKQRGILEQHLYQSQKLDAIGQLAGGVAHDFNNILTGILGYANLLQIKSEAGTFVHDAAKTIESAAERASELTRQLLGFARKGKTQTIDFDVNNMIRDVISLLARTIDKKIRIERAFRAKGAVSGDPNQMQQVILNLAVNARDAMPDGGVILFETDTVFIDEEASEIHGGISPGYYALVTVSDTGCGIPAENIDRVMEPFFTTKEKGKGTGMGLAMVYGIVKNHGGSIRIESEVGKGSIFRLLFPCSSEHAFADEPVEPAVAISEQPVRGNGRILLVDDEAFVRGIASEMLRLIGYRVAVASDGREAVDYYRQHGHEIDLVVLDMIMPEMNGHECYLELKKINPAVRALLSSGYGLNGKTGTLLEDGLSGFITKPYRLREFSEAIRNALC